MWKKLTFSLFIFIHTTKIYEKEFSSYILSLAIIPTSNNSQINFRNVVKICFQAISDVRLYDFVEKHGGFHWKNSNEVETPQVDGLLRKILKHQIEVDSNPWWLVPVSFLYDNKSFGSYLNFEEQRFLILNK